MSSSSKPARPNDAPASPRAMHIGEVATRTDLSLRSLRHWDEVGLLRPSGRTDGGFRLYTEDDVERILLIRRMKPLGFSLDEMCQAMSDIDALRTPTTEPTHKTQAHDRLANVETDAQARRQKLVIQLAMADEFIALLRDELSEDHGHQSPASPA